MSVPELCRNFSAVAWCGKLNAIACASETCASIPSSNANAPFWIPIHIVFPERPTERAVFNVNADSPRDSVQFIEWSPTSCPRALLIANFHGRVTIWTQPSQGQANLVRDARCWQQEHEWRQDIAVVTKWLSGVSPNQYKLLSSKSSTSSNGKSTFEEKSISRQSQNSARWPSFLCVCSVFSSGSVQLHWSQYPPNQTGAAPKWFQTSKGLLGVGHSGIMAADAIITDCGAMHVAGVPIVNPSTVVVWEVAPGLGNGFHATPKISTTDGVPPSMNPPIWAGFSPLAAYLFSWQDYLLSEAKQRRKQTDQDFSDTLPLHCSLVSNFSAYMSPEAASQSATTTTWGFGVTAVAFDPTRGGSVIAVVIVEGQYMSEGPSITGWRVQRWESSLQPVVLHQIFGNPTSSFGGQAPMQTVWLSKVDTSIQPTNDFKSHQAAATTATTDARKTPDSGTLARIVYSAHGGEIAVAFLLGGVHIFSGSNFAPVDNYQINVGSAIAAPAFSSTSCCSASVWHDSVKDRTVLKIIRVLPPAVPSSPVKANSSTWEWAIAKRFWWSLFDGLDWWDVVGCTRSAAEDGIVSLNSVIAAVDANFHSLPSTQERQRFGHSLDRLKCRLLEGTNAQEVGAMVLHKQTRLLNPSALVPGPWYEEQDDDKKRELEMKIEELMNPNMTSLNAPKEKIKTKGRPCKVNNSTRRLPSAFEIAEVELAQSEFDCQTPISSTMASVSTVSRRKKKQKDNVTTPSNKKRKENVITLPKKKQRMNLVATSPIMNADIVLDQLSCDIQTLETNILPQLKQFKVGKTDMYGEAFPEAIRTYITGQTDVTRDGNCGYNVISMALGIDNGWRKVRRDLLHQLRQMPFLFKECFVGNDRYAEIERALDYFEDGFAPEYSWLIMPDMGHIIATCYNMVLIHLSMTQCITFLPYSLESSSQSSDTDLREVAIGYLTKDHHFIQVHLCKGHPMPPVSTMWHKKSQTSSDIRVKNLYSKYQGRVDQFKQLPGLENVATNDIVDLEDD